MSYSSIVGSFNSASCIGVKDKDVFLITAAETLYSFSLPSSFTAGQSIVFSEQCQIVALSSFEEGVCAYDIRSKRKLWQLKHKGVYKMRLSTDEQTVVLCRSEPLDVTCVAVETGKIMERWKSTKDLCVHSMGERSLALAGNQTILMSNDGSSRVVEWGSFAVYSFVFTANHAVLTGPNSTIASYDLTSLTRTASTQNNEYEKCDPIGWSEDRGQLIGAIFEPHGKEVISIVEIDFESLQISRELMAFDLASEVVLYGGGKWVLTSSGDIHELV